MFQDQISWKMIGFARECDGLYYLEDLGGGPIKGNQPTPSQAFLAISNKQLIWVHHLPLSHPHFSLLEYMFPLLFKDTIVFDFQCEVCQFEKHYRTSFPINSIKCSKPFSLIHFDIWEPAKIFYIFYIHGTRWFVTFIDDYIRIAWLFFMKDKSEVSSLLPQFHKMIFTQFGARIRRFRSNNA